MLTQTPKIICFSHEPRYNIALVDSTDYTINEIEQRPSYSDHLRLTCTPYFSFAWPTALELVMDGH